MKICNIDSHLNLVILDEDTHLESMNNFAEKGHTEALAVTSNQRADKDNKFYIFFGYDKRKIRLCHYLLRIIGMNGWIPTSSAIIPLRLCEKEIIESLLGCDPDVVSVLNLRWGRQLQKLLRRRYPQWTCLARPDETLNIDLEWRKFNPSSEVSIVLPTYNGAKYICKSIESCLKQTFRKVELIIVDDGSTQDIPELIKVYQDPRIRYFRHDDNRGLSEALNTGFRNSVGEYLTWTSDDNYYTEDAIEEMVRFLQTYPEVDFVYAESYMIDEGRKDQGLRILRNKPVEGLKVDNYIGACFLYRRKVYEVIGEYNPQLPLVEDYDYWVRVSRQFKMQRLFRPLYHYRFHADALTSKHNREEVLEKIKLVQQLNNSQCKQEK